MPEIAPTGQLSGVVNVKRSRLLGTTLVTKAYVVVLADEPTGKLDTD